MKYKGIKKLENLVHIEERLHERQFNELLKFYEKNQDLCWKIPISGKSQEPAYQIFSRRLSNESMKSNKFYPYPGIALAMKESVTLQESSFPNPYTNIFYIPKNKKFISVKSSFKRDDNKYILTMKYSDFKEMTKEEVKPYFRFCKTAGAFLGHDSNPMKSIKYTAYKFKSPWQMK